MPTIEDNIRLWDVEYNWSKRGDEWSACWGGTDMQWYGAILPRIHRFIPTRTILEIAPGFGRWTEFLKDFCNNLILVDLSKKCIQSCKDRFASCSHITYFVNDGKTLEMISDKSIDFVFSFDSLVHAEDDVMKVYISELSQKLKKDGVGFLHHSNIGEYSTDSNIHLRAFSMTADKFRQFAREYGLQCISQEIINWGTKRLIDCISVFTKKDSTWSCPNKVVRNKDFMKEANYILKLSRLYGINGQV